MSDVTVRLGGVSKRYGQQIAVTDVDLVLREGERIALVGHNGAGKSTLIKLMLGLIRPTSGDIEVLGETPASAASAKSRRRIGYLPENVAFPPATTGEELLAFYARLKREPVARNGEILERVGIAHAARRRVGTYSKGMRQRLGLAQALIGRPRLLLLDEPTTGLDPELRQSFYDIVGELSVGGATVLLSSHILTELEGRTDRVVVMSRGRKRADGTMAELRQLAQRPVRIKITVDIDRAALFPGAAGRRDRVAADRRARLRGSLPGEREGRRAAPHHLRASDVGRPGDLSADARRCLCAFPAPGGSGMRAVALIAAKEIRDGLRNRWVAATTLLMAALALTLTLLGSAPTGTVGASHLSVTVVSLSSLTIFLVPLIALLISYDAIAGEIERGTLPLLLSYPVARWQVIAGKFLGHTGILAIATVIGYGAAGAALALAGGPAETAGAWFAFGAMMGSSVLLGMAFVALGYLASALVRDPRTAGGIAIGLWLFFALIYDMALLGLLVADQGKTVTVPLMNGLLLANPTDIYRLLNLTGFADVSLFAGMAGLSEQVRFGSSLLVTALAAWITLPLGVAALIFRRREL